jgi:hypothetical protein
LRKILGCLISERARLAVYMSNRDICRNKFLHLTLCHENTSSTVSEYLSYVKHSEGQQILARIDDPFIHMNVNDFSNYFFRYPGRHCESKGTSIPLRNRRSIICLRINQYEKKKTRFRIFMPIFDIVTDVWRFPGFAELKVNVY